MSTKRRLHTLIANPLVLVPPLVLVLGLGWQQYTYAGRNLNLPDSSNIFPDSSLSTFKGGAPAGWTNTQSGDLHYTSGAASGYTEGQAYRLQIDRYGNGDLATSGPVIGVAARTTYLFKAYYTASTSFSLLVRTTHHDGSSTLAFVRAYPATAKNNWSTTSYAFASGSDIVQFQVLYRLASGGSLEINSPYLEPRTDVYVAPEISGNNLIPNPTFAVTNYDNPDGWSTYHTGTGTAEFSYDHDNRGAFVATELSGYRSGETKWQYPPQPVSPHQYYQFAVTYKSTVGVPVIAEYTRADGSHTQQTIGQTLPADSWTTATYSLETPPDAASLFVSLPLQQNGVIASRGYHLVNQTRPGPPSWQQPLVSVTFDDGWQSSYAKAVPLLKSYGYKATFYINPATIETPGFMTAADLSALSASGNEIAAHGYEHDDLTAINRAALDYQLHEGRDYLRRAGFGVTDAATPYGRSDPEVAWYARKYYSTMRSTETGINTRQNFDPYNLQVLYVNDFTPLQTVRTALAQTKAYNGWLILVYHRIGDNLSQEKSLPVESSTTTGTALRSQLRAVQASGIAVLPVAAAYSTVMKQ